MPGNGVAVEGVKNDSTVLIQGQEATSGGGVLVDTVPKPPEEREGSLCVCLPTCLSVFEHDFSL